MSLRRTLAVVHKELRHITRDARILLLVTISPALLGLTFSYVFSFDVDQASLAVLDMDMSRHSRQYVRALTADGDFLAAEYATDPVDLERALLAGRIDVALVIPPGFSEHLNRGESVQVQAIVDGLDTVSARTNVGYLEARSAARHRASMHSSLWK